MGSQTYGQAVYLHSEKKKETISEIQSDPRKLAAATPSSGGRDASATIIF